MAPGCTWDVSASPTARAAGDSLDDASTIVWPMLESLFSFDVFSLYTLIKLFKHYAVIKSIKHYSIIKLIKIYTIPKLINS